ncbi:MAG: ABC transporter permease [Rhodobacteraceae bacterium]|nr:ABC transporter permease [Paracoccaceae bacterium]
MTVQSTEFELDLPEHEAPSPRAIVLRRARHHSGFLFGSCGLGLIILLALAAPLLAPHNPIEQNLLARLQPPVWAGTGDWNHVLGTDQLGRDYLSRLLYGAQLSLLIGISAMIISGLIGTLLGVLAGYFGGRVDLVITFIITSRLSMPIVLIALAVAAIFGSSLQLVIVILGFLLWDGFAIVARSSTLQIRDADFLLAARSLGMPAWRLILFELLPNIKDALIVVATLEMAHAILLESALSFLGLGVQPPRPSWGLMIAEGKDYLFFEPWLIMIPGAALFLLVMSINLLGDGLRDISAPEGRS